MMRCPRCQQGIHQGAESCPHCGFRLEDLLSSRAFQFPPCQRLEDAAGLVRQRERAKLVRAMEHFDSKFPGLFFAVHSCRLENPDDLHLFGIALLNQAPFTDLKETQHPHGGLALILDPHHKMATLTWGYRLDPLLTEHDTFLALSRAHAYWLEGQFAAGMIRVIQHMTLTLIKRIRHAKRHQRKNQRTNPAE